MKVKFHSPHPGVGGAAVALPSALKNLIDSFDGREAELDELLWEVNFILSKWEKAKAWANLEDRYVSVQVETPAGYIHHWLLIRFEMLETKNKTGSS